MQKNYEIMTIAKYDLGEEAAKELSDQVAQEIESFKGSISERKFWGRRKFAYPINHEVEGFYDVLNFQLEDAKVAELKGNLNSIESLIRYLVTATE